MSRPARVLKFPGMLSIEQLVAVVDMLEERIDRLEKLAEAGKLASWQAGKPSKSQELENRRHWHDAMDAFIAGDKGALKRFTAGGGWTPPKEYR